MASTSVPDAPPQVQDVYQPPTYPCIGFLVRHGMTLAAIVFVAAAALGWFAGQHGLGWVGTAVGVGGGALLALILASYVEVLKIMTETLMPR